MEYKHELNLCETRVSVTFTYYTYLQTSASNEYSNFKYLVSVFLALQEDPYESILLARFTRLYFFNKQTRAYFQAACIFSLWRWGGRGRTLC